METIDLCEKDNQTNDTLITWEWYDTLKFNKLLFSIKPLKLKYWLPKEQVKALTNE